MPSEYGQRLAPYFPFQPSYWRGAKPPAGPSAAAQSGMGEAAAANAAAPPTEGKGGAAVAVRRLCKDFATTDGCVKRAVDGLSLDVQAGQVTALLGASAAPVWIAPDLAANCSSAAPCILLQGKARAWHDLPRKLSGSCCRDKQAGS